MWDQSQILGEAYEIITLFYIIGRQFKHTRIVEKSIIKSLLKYFLY